MTLDTSIVASEGGNGAAGPGSDGAVRVRVALEYAIEGDLRFLAHHDELRMLIRALVRAEWPLAYSQGFNPLPKLTLPMPRPLGLASRCSLAVVGLERPVAPEALQARLSAALPVGAAVQRVSPMVSRRTPRAERVRFAVTLRDEDQASGAERLSALFARSVIDVRRDMGPDKPARRVNIRPFLASYRLSGRELSLDVYVESQRTARITEILEELELPVDQYGPRVWWEQISWQ